MSQLLEKSSLYFARFIHLALSAFGALRAAFRQTRCCLSSLLRALLFRREPERGRFAPSAFHRFVCAVMVMVMSAQMVLASPQISDSVVETVSIRSINWWQEVDHWWASSGWEASTSRFVRENLPFLRAAKPPRKGWDGKGAPAGERMPRPRPQETQAERYARVERVEVIPAEITVRPDQSVEFIVIGYDGNNAPVSSLPFELSGEDEKTGEQVKAAGRGKFAAAREGEYLVKVNALGHQAEARVKVKAAPQALSDRPAVPYTYSSRDLPPAPRSTSSVSPKDRRPGRQRGKIAGRLASRYAASGTKLMAAIVQGADQYTWNDGNARTADDPGSTRGMLAGEPPDGGAGSSNFQFTAPVLADEGRGLDLDLGMYYNSRLWHKDGLVITYNIDGEQVPGWRFGFSKIMGMGEQSGFMIMEANGTRRPYTCTITPQQPIGFADCKTTDGSFIDYHVEANYPGGKPISARMALPDGTVITMDSANPYGSGPNAVYVQNIQDSHGNRINVAYVPHSFPYTGEPKMRYIINTMGKVIQFYYNADHLPVAVTAPGLDGTRRTVVRITYDWINKSSLGSFSTMVPLIRSNSYPRVKAIYYPESKTGWYFGDTGSYSAYGMLAKVSNQRGMVFSGAPLPADSLQPADQGTITPGVMTYQQVYDYPLASSGLRDEPRYQTLTESWAHMDEGPAVTRYLVQEDATPRRTEITQPNGVKKVMLSYNAPGDFKNGRIYQNETHSPQGVLLSRSYIEWEEGNCPEAGQAPGQYQYCAPRVSRIETTDERGQKTGREFSYGTMFNQVEEARFYDYGYEFDGTKTLLRKTKTEYVNDGKYIDYRQRAYGSHIFNLVAAREVYAGDGTTRLSRVEYTYDQFTGTGGLKDTPEITTDGYNDYFNPHSNPTSESTWKRGDVTTVKRYAKAATLESAISETMKYDVTGNVVKVVPECCGQTTIDYTANTQYAWPGSVTSGSATEATKQNKTFATYDFGTGLLKNSTDANGRISQYDYVPGTTRPLKEIGPTGAYTYHEYDDGELKVIDFAYDAGEDEDNYASRIDKHLNGQGGVRLAIAYGKDDVKDQVATRYDQMRRVKQQSRPYRDGETPLWSTMAYDYLDRLEQTTGPDGSVVRREYNLDPEPEGASGQPGQTVRVTDAWSREQWVRTDARGRLVEVIEPNPDGDGTVGENGIVTTYSYDDLDRLIEVRQGEQPQIRKFGYNSFGQVMYQKLAEQAATLNEEGEYVETGGQWSSVFKYDPSTSLMIESVDARGVKTKFDYSNDPFDRLQSMSYDKGGVPENLVDTIPDAAKVELFYMATGDLTRVQKMKVGSGMVEDTTSYDSEGRVSEVKRTFAGRVSYPLVTNYEWDPLGRMTSMTYPAQYGAGENRKKVEYTYDSASRIESMKFGGVPFASNPVYNAADQTTSLEVGSEIVEKYGYDVKTGLLTTQQVVRDETDILVDLKYNYTLTNDANNNGAKTGQLTGIADLKNPARNRAYKYDKLRRLKKVQGGANAFTSPDWSQTYNYDGYGNKLGVTKTGNAPHIPLDGMGSISVNAANNRITSAGAAYDDAGNQTSKIINESGVQQQHRFDAAGRFVQALDGSGTTVLASYSYGAGNQRVMSVEGGVTRYFAWGGEGILGEYEAVGASGLQWKTSYVYLGGQLMATTSGGDGSETRFHHPGRLSETRLVTDATNGEVVAEQLSLPYGTMQPNGAYGGDNSYQHPTKNNPSKKRFTTYDQDASTEMHYAVNRYYSSRQGRFTQVDPIEMGSVELGNPQSLNLYSYVEGDPVNRDDRWGLDGPSFSQSSGGPYPTGGGGGWWNWLLSIGPFGFSFGANSGFGHPVILWFPLPMNSMMLLTQQMQMQQQPMLPKLQQSPAAQSIVMKSGTGGQDGTGDGRRRPTWEEIDRLLNPTDEDYKRIWLERHPSHDGMVPDPTQPPISQWIYGRRMIHYTKIALEDYKYGFMRFEPGAPGGGVGVGAIKNIFASIRASGVIPAGWKIAQNGLQKVKINNQALLKELQAAKPGKWVKVYAKGVDGREFHWFQHESGAVFNVKPK
jgi:RHS repeat-associated protein